MNHFLLFKTIYPRKTGSWAKAKESWDKAIASGVRPEDIFEGLQDEIHNWIAEDVEPKFIPMAATWLNQRRWEGGLSIDIAALSKKCYDQYTDAEWRYCHAMGTITDSSKKFMPDHIKRELYPLREVV